MANWSLYESRMTIDGLTEKEVQVNSMKNSVLNNFDNSPSFEQVLINGIEQDVNIVEESVLSTNSNKKKIICKPDETISVGDIVVFNNDEWICTESDTTSEIYDVGIISVCTNTLKFYPSSTNPNENQILSGLIEIPCIVSKGSLGLDVNKFMSLPADEYIVTCAENDKSSYITENTRFILGKSAYIVLGIDDISTIGLLNIRVKETQIDTADDRIDLGIANYWSNQIVREIYILNGTEASLLYTNAILQLDIQARDNGVIVSNPIVSFTTSSAYVCSVSATGLITALGTGDAVVTATYGTSTATITIHSEMVVSDNYSIVLSPTDTTLKLSRSLVLTAKSMKNGIEDTTRQFVWSLSNLDGTSGNYASIAVNTINDDVCTILASSSSSVANKYIVVKCTLTSDASVFTTRQIKIINLF